MCVVWLLQEFCLFLILSLIHICASWHIPNRNVDETLELVKDIFASAGERDIYTGDFVDIYVITKDGTKYEQFPLKKD